MNEPKDIATLLRRIADHIDAGEYAGDIDLRIIHHGMFVGTVETPVRTIPMTYGVTLHIPKLPVK